MTISI